MERRRRSVVLLVNAGGSFQDRIKEPSRQRKSTRPTDWLLEEPWAEPELTLDQQQLGWTTATDRGAVLTASVDAGFRALMMALVYLSATAWLSTISTSSNPAAEAGRVFVTGERPARQADQRSGSKERSWVGDRPRRR